MTFKQKIGLNKIVFHKQALLKTLVFQIFHVILSQKLKFYNFLHHLRKLANRLNKLGRRLLQTGAAL